MWSLINCWRKWTVTTTFEILSLTEVFILAKFCSNCGAQLEDGVKFCGSCGAAQNAVQQATVQSPQSTTIQISRTWRFVNFLFDEEIYIDDVKIGAVSNGKSQTFNISPGKHKLQVKMTYPFLSGFFHSKPMDFNINGGENLKFNCNYIFGTLATVTGFGFIITIFNGFKVIKIEQLP